MFLLADDTVLKLHRDPAAAHVIEREAAALRALATAGVPAVAVHGTVVVDGRPGLVLERRDGTDFLAQAANPLRLDDIAAAMARAHAALHEVVAPASLPTLRERLARQIESAPPLPDDLRRRALDVLEGLPDGDRLCHGDLHPGNLLGTLADPVVIDWGCASRGDPVGDVVRSSLMLRLGEPPAGAPLLIRTLAPVGGGIAAARYVAHYRRVRSLETARFAEWRIVIAAGRLDEHIPEEVPRLLRSLRRDLRGR